jgi:hypothetical protein
VDGRKNKKNFATVVAKFFLFLFDVTNASALPFGASFFFCGTNLFSATALERDRRESGENIQQNIFVRAARKASGMLSTLLHFMYCVCKHSAR